MNDDIQFLLHQTLQSFSFEDFGLVTLKTPLSISQYKEWLKKDYQGDMNYLKDHLDIKENPQSHFQQMNSALVVSRRYLPHPHPPESDFPIQHLKVARYAQGKDYHHWFKEELNQVCEELNQSFPQNQFLPMTDSGPVLERDLAYQAGLGWVGKNSCLIHSQRGSFFFIGEIYTDLKSTHSPLPHPDRCGKCSLCVEACPTQALTPERTMDARRCLSYLNIEASSLPHEDLLPRFDNWFFGCDICQQVCPWNKKHHDPIELKDPDPDLESIRNEILWILSESNKQLQKKLIRSPLLRARPLGLKRNALIMIYSHNLRDLKSIVKKFTDHERLGPLAQWILEQWRS